MSIDGIAALVFVVLLGFFLWQKRHRVELQKALFPILYVVMYRSRFGLPSMDKLAKKFPRTLRVLGDISIVLGFIGMVFIVAQLAYNTVDVFINEGVPGIQPVLPVQAKGVFFVPFLYWILSIFLLALVHEFAHGVLARVHNIPVKSSGFAFLCLLLPVIPAAFVEPDEKIVQRRPYRQQLGVFAAGPISNMLFALVMFGVFFLLSPVLDGAFDVKGVELVKVEESGAAFAGGLREGDVVTGVNGVELTSVQNISALLNASVPGDVLLVQTVNESLSVTAGSNPKDASKAYLGIQAAPYTVPNPDFAARYGSWLPPALKWFAGLIFWLFMLNVGIGLFNLLPIGPLDGGRMFQLVCFRIFKNRAAALKVWMYVSVFLVALILANLFSGFIR
jgi:membrane-associated protease RseP (regulator of RpoE activity)